MKQKKKHVIIITISLLFLLTLNMTAQQLALDKEYITNVKQYTPEDGLSHRVVNCFAKDSRGVMWIGTQNGLNRFDGLSFKSFYKKDGLYANHIYRIYAVDNVLLCLHHDIVVKDVKKLSVFDVLTEKVIPFDNYFKNKAPFKEDDILKIEPTVYIDGKKGELKFLVKGDDSANEYLFDGSRFINVSHLSNDRYDVSRISVKGNFWLFDKIVNKYVEMDSLGNILQEENSNVDKIETYSIIEKENGELLTLLGDYNGNKILYISKSKDGKKVSDDIEFPSKKDKLRSLDYIINSKIHYSSSLNAIWFYSYNRKISALYHENGKKIIDIKYANGKAHSQSYQDNNIIWQSGTNGFYQIKVIPKQFIAIFNNGQYKDFRGITRIGGDIVMLSYSGTFILNPDTYDYSKTSGNGISILKRRRGDYLTTNNDGFDFHDFNNNKTNSIKPQNIYETWSIYEDKDDWLWYSYKGLNAYHPDKDLEKDIKFNGFDELKTKTVYHFYEKSDGNIFLCSTGGLYELSLEKGIIARYWSGGEGKYKIPAKDFRHLYFDKKDNSYWLATNQEGLIHWIPKESKITVYPINEFQSPVIHSVYADDFGYLWMSTENGIIRFNKETHTINTYLPKDGTSSHEFNRASYFQDEDGTIYFGSINGVTIFHPKDFVKEEEEKAIKIIPVELMQYQNSTHQLEDLTGELNTNNRIFINTGDRFFTLKLALTDYSQGKNTTFHYKTKNDKGWTTAESNELYISGLPFGRQTLQIRALLSDGTFTPQILEIPIYVQRPLFLRWWFLLLSASTIGGSVVYYTRTRTQQLNKRNEILELEVAKRTHKIETDKQIIEQQAQELQELDETKSRFFANVSHELRTPITLIQGPIQTVLGMQENSNKGFTLLSIAEQNTKKLLKLVNEILALTRFDVKRLNLQEEPVVLYNFLRRITGSFQSIADRQKITFSFEYRPSQELQLQLDKDKFEIILNNLLSNAFKFTSKGGDIFVQVQEIEGTLVFKVQDTGRGIQEADIPYIFNRFYQSSKNKKAEGGFGIGLSLSMEYVKLMKGEMWVESSTSEQNHGTTFFVKIPKKEAMTMLSTIDKLSIQSQNTPKLIGETVLPTISTSSSHQQLLIVEDNHDLSNYLKIILSPYYEVAIAENGQEALNWLKANELPSLIISDVMMPIMDGFEFLELVKKNELWSNLPFVMLTARIELKDKLKALRIGVDDYLLKPFKEEELLIRIENLLTNYEERVAYAQSQEEAQPQTTKATLKISKADNLWLEQLEVKIQENITDSRFSVDYLSEMLNINRNALYKKTKLLTGLTPNQYIRIVRLQIAKELLETGTYKTIKEIAAKVGFQRPDYFAKLYKKEYGKAPIEYFE